VVRHQAGDAEVTAATPVIAPDFTLKNQHGEDVRLSSFRGERNVVVVFYPFAFSGVCTGELQAIRDNPDVFGDAEVLVVSCDPMYALRAWDDAEKFGFSLLSDFWPHGAAASSYGVFDADRGCALRGTFIVDRDGKVAWSVVNALPDARDLEDYRKALATLS
jgi:mycoredoxin-dependent peroxiredoxin